MKQLIERARTLSQSSLPLPFAVYSSVREQNLRNVPIIKPVLIAVLDGCKQLDLQRLSLCDSGQFLFLSNLRNVQMRNIPKRTEYFALLIEFEFSDFAALSDPAASHQRYFSGAIEPLLQHSLQQFVEWSAAAPAELWPGRRLELLRVLDHLGHHAVRAVVESPLLSQRLQRLISADVTADWSTETLCEHFALSESSLRRKLRAEGTTLQSLKDSARLGLGLHLIQTTMEPISRVAERCGYQSQSRFTDKFKQLYGLTPSELRRTRMDDLGEGLAVLAL